MMAVSQTAWIAAVLVARLLAVAALAVSVQRKYINRTRNYYVNNYYDLQSYKLMDLPPLQEPEDDTQSPHPQHQHVVTVVLASGVGAGFGVIVDVLQFIKHVTWDKDENDRKGDLISYYNRESVAIIFLLVGMALYLCASVISARLRARARDDPADV